MLNYRLGLGSALRSFLLEMNIVALLFSIGSAYGSAYYSLSLAPSVTVTSPPVLLGGGTAGTSTIYTNSTSAKARVVTPTQNETQDYVDNNTSNVDSSADKGTHGNFSAQQTGPNSIYDALKEEDTSVTVNNWGITSSAFTSTSTVTSYRYIGGTSPNIDNMTVTRLHIRYGGTGTVAIALYSGGLLTDPTGAIKRTEAYNVAVSNGWNAIDVPDYSWPKNTITWIGWAHGGGNVYYSTNPADAGDFQSARGRWNQNSPADADETSPMPTNPGDGSFSNNWYAVYAEYRVPNCEIDLEVQWTNVDFNEQNEELAIYAYKENTHSLDATGGYMLIGGGTPNWGSVTGTISFWIWWDTVGNRPWGQHENMEIRFSGSNLVLDWGATSSLTSSTTFTANKWYFIAITWDENTNDLYLYVGDQSNAPTQDQYVSWASAVSTVGVTQNNFMASKGGVNPTDGRGDDLRYWNIDRTLAQIQSDYKSQLTGSETNLRSFFKLNNNFDDIGPNNNDGSGSGSYSFTTNEPFAPSENIRVDVWTGSTWQSLFTDLTNGWNNISVSSYLNSSTFTIRFKGTTETNDVMQDTWNIDATLLHVWTSKGNFNYVLIMTENHGSNWKVKLRAYAQSSIGRLKNCSIYIYNGSNSTQIAILNGLYSQQTGPWYDLAASDIEYIWIHVERSNAGTSYIYAYLEILVPSKTTYVQYILTFEIT